MLKWALLVVLTPPLLMPPGVCVCHLLGEEDAHAAPAHAPVTAPVGDVTTHIDPAEDPDEHPPGCPSRKHTDGQCRAQPVEPPLPADRVGDFLAPIPAAPQVVPSLGLTPFSARPPAPPDRPVYLTVRALLI